MEKQENVDELHGNLRNVQAGSSSTEGVEVGANDLINELPDDILCHVLSFLLLGEAARTGTLSRRWKNLWRRSLSLNFDIQNMALRNARRRVHIMFLMSYPGAHLSQADALMLQNMKLRFVAWVSQVLSVHDSAKIVFLRVNFPLLGDYNDYVVQWIKNAAAKGVEKLHIILSEPWRILPFGQDCFEFPFWVFAQADGRCFLKHLVLDYCTFNPPADFCSFRNLIALSLRNAHVSQDNLNIIFSCMMLESFRMSLCFVPDELKIAGGSESLKLKHMNISLCFIVKEVEICDAPSLSSFEFRGPVLRKLLFRNSAKPVKLCFFPCLDNEAGNSYAFRQLSFDFPEVRTLLFGYITIKDFAIPTLLSTFCKLKELVLMLDDVEIMLKMTKTLLMASPFLHRLEVNLPSEKTSNMPNNLDIENTFQHNYLKEVKMINFLGVPLQLQLAIYLLRSAAELRSMTILRRGQMYIGDFRWVKFAREPEVTKERVLELFRGDVPVGLEFIVL